MKQLLQYTYWLDLLRKLVHKLRTFEYVSFVKELLFFIRFFMLVLLYLFLDAVRFVWRILAKIPGMRWVLGSVSTRFVSGYSKAIALCNVQSVGEISSLDLIILAVRHLKAKKNRTIITIGGMAIGFGSVIFLLSLGYGAQKLVVSRVARLSELKQVDVTTGQASALQINDESLARIAEIPGVDVLLPMVSVVSKVEFNNSVSDAVVYGVERRFLEESAIQPTQGTVFSDGEVVSVVPNPSTGMVAGAQDERSFGAKLYKQTSQIKYSIFPLVWKPVYSEPSTQSTLLGYTKRDAGMQDAYEVWGNPYPTVLDLPKGYDFFENEYQTWISDSFLIWKKEACTADSGDCIDGLYRVSRVGSMQEMSAGYITEDDVVFERYNILPEATPAIEEGTVVEKVEFVLPNKSYIPVHSQPNTTTQLVQLFTHQDSADLITRGELVYGERYSDDQGWGAAATNANGEKVGLWIRAKLPLWRQIDCIECEALYLQEVDSFDVQVEAYAFIKASQVSIEGVSEPPVFGQVLGDATESAQLAAVPTTQIGTDSAAVVEEELPTGTISLADGTVITATTLEDGTLDWVTISSDSAGVTEGGREMIDFPEGTQKVALVNRAFLNVLGVAEDVAVGQVFSASLKLDSEFFTEDYQAETHPVNITIIGVTPDEKTPAYYMPLSDIQSLGIQNYSQLKVITAEEKDVAEVRKSIEALGFRTASVVDTVSRINSLFGTVRLVLSVLGMVALSIAALGMFNTLTVSLLEKTREVGLMKAIGMKSNEVKRLFLAESIIMGVSGGIFGLILGIVSGQALSFFVSLFAISQGQGYISLVSVPFFLGFGIVSLAFVVGILTGLYPSHRATKISALNALRYE